jgi:[ribosomal protein S18]-alanine N-acetyltransferase
LHIRPAGQEDITDIAAIEKTAQSAWSYAQIKAELEHSNTTILVAAKNRHKSIVGWCCARHIPPEAELLKITLMPQHRRSGIGSALISTLFKHCLKTQCNEIYLEVRLKNQAALQFYRKIGFLRLAQRKNYYRDPIDDCLIFKKFL